MPISNLKNLTLNLQLFADGGASAGASSGVAGSNGVGMQAGDNSSNASIPAEDTATAKPKIVYGKQNKNTVENGTDTQKQNQKLSFEDLVKSEDYQAQAKEYMDKAFSKRFSKYQNIEAENSKMREILDMQNMRYGLDPSSATYLDDYASKVENDTKLYEDEAMAVGMTAEDYMKVKNAERIIQQNKRTEAQREQDMIIQNHIQNLMGQAESLKSKIPSLNLEVELSNPQFRKMVDTPELGGLGLSVENAFKVIHHDEIMKATVNNAVEQVAISTANAVSSNKSRPKESGLSTKASVIVKDDPSKLTKSDFDKIREEYRRTGKRVSF